MKGNIKTAITLHVSVVVKNGKHQKVIRQKDFIYWIFKLASDVLCVDCTIVFKIRYFVFSGTKAYVALAFCFFF